MSRDAVRVLLVAAVVAVLLAVFVRNSRSGGTLEVDQPLVSFAADAAGIDRVEIEQGNDRIDVQRKDGLWVLQSRDGFPAKSESVQEVVRGLDGLRKSQQMTAKPERHGDLGIAWPDPSGTARRVRVFAAGKEKPLADVVIGRTAAAPTGVYARGSDDPQVWRCTGVLNIPAGVTGWLATPVADFPSDQLQRITLEDVTLTRSGTEWNATTSDGQPAASAPRLDTIKNTLPFLLTGFAPDDVRREIPEDASRAGVIEAQAWVDDANSIAIRMWMQDGKVWTRLAPGACGAQHDARIDGGAQRWSGWVFQLPSWRSDYLKPMFEAAAPAAAQPADPALPADAALPATLPAVP